MCRKGGVGGRKEDCNDSGRDEAPEEQLKVRKQYIYRPHGTMSSNMTMPRP